MVLLSIVLSIMLVLQVTFAPYINPPNVPEGIRLSPPDLIEVACSSFELLILLAGYIRFTTPATTASDILTAIAAMLSLFGPPAYAIYSRRAHSEWYETTEGEGKSSPVKMVVNPVTEETSEDVME